MRIYLAPMEGLLDSVLRDILTRVGGVDLCVSEFVRVSGSRLPNSQFQRVAPELRQGSRTSSGVPVRVQLLGSDPRFMALNAAALAALGPAGIDLNFGCPAKTVNRHQGGAILLREPERIYHLVCSVRSALPAGMALTAKMRLGYEDKSLAIDCAQAMEAGGASELVVHARTKTEGYRPPAHWEWIARIQAAVQVPVIANGEIWSLADYRRCREFGGVKVVMLGRGMVAKPALARIIKEGEGAALQWPELQRLLGEFWQLLAQRLQAKPRCGRIKQWLNYLRMAYPEAEALFREVRTLTDSDEMEQILYR
ncbi:MAG: tRNA-dihydrouridine synthase [Methylococcaceae bacterium]|nr:tRNA-dihydrouridine synthase [Methylococcaceae bacterium]